MEWAPQCVFVEDDYDVSSGAPDFHKSLSAASRGPDGYGAGQQINHHVGTQEHVTILPTLKPFKLQTGTYHPASPVFSEAAHIRLGGSMMNYNADVAAAGFAAEDKV